ncbi:hypothetical protein SODALDRAFT_376285 [Sodiomyces alkalinus F11]|uniref:Uncharacterized protein n=1 Tax=Sodiomyces alkalinus (strain CBS 110278 / VKM F-3762 / F11) TaxID=1314773 RepID=A0A3N2Q179_SODAK|nr:hypothetical protein SODALDRAFT_376285 [Sodiomyces alkalinus F11]ROT40500.1 hypothetical protein SODALDRAFT_376285 [Sodiomyces alkalinus F11]
MDKRPIAFARLRTRALDTFAIRGVANVASVLGAITCGVGFLSRLGDTGAARVSMPGIDRGRRVPVEVDLAKPNIKVSSRETCDASILMCPVGFDPKNTVPPTCLLSERRQVTQNSAAHPINCAKKLSTGSQPPALDGRQIRNVLVMGDTMLVK